MTLLFAGVGVVFALFACVTLHQLQWMQRLPQLRQDAGRPQTVLVSAVIAARDEEARIEQTVRQLFRQRGVALEIIVVDDRSRDSTPAILERLQAEDSRLQILRVNELPEGWLGKCHACHLGAEKAKGDWILFTDADCWSKEDVVARALQTAQTERADHLTMCPLPAGTTAGAKAWYLLFLTSLGGWFAGVNRDKPKSYVGIGAFNLVSKAAYQASGGYEKLRLTVVDDVKLGLLLSRAGKRTRAYLAGSDLGCQWGGTVPGMVKIMEKNYFAAIDYKTGLALAGSAFVFAVIVLLIAGVLSGTVVGWLAAASPLLLVPPATILSRRLGWPALPAWGMPFMFPVFFYTLIFSAWKTLRAGGVRWRDTFYPLDQLKKWNVQ